MYIINKAKRYNAKTKQTKKRARVADAVSPHTYIAQHFKTSASTPVYIAGS